MSKTLIYLATASCFTLSISLAHAESKGHDEHMSGGMHEMSGEHMSSGQMPGGQMAEQHFKEMDTNGDGVVSKAEFDASHDKHFKDLDTNGDGKLSLDEMKAGHKEMMGEHKMNRFDELDTNHDGFLSREEVKDKPMLAKHFDELDTNKDGKLTREEMKAGWEKKHKEHDEKPSSGW